MLCVSLWFAYPDFFFFFGQNVKPREVKETQGDGGYFESTAGGGRGGARTTGQLHCNTLFTRMLAVNSVSDYFFLPSLPYEAECRCIHGR